MAANSAVPGTSGDPLLLMRYSIESTNLLSVVPVLDAIWMNPTAPFASRAAARASTSLGVSMARRMASSSSAETAGLAITRSRGRGIHCLPVADATLELTVSEFRPSGGARWLSTRQPCG